MAAMMSRWVAYPAVIFILGTIFLLVAFAPMVLVWLFVGCVIVVLVVAIAETLCADDSRENYP
jgi:hypothetical protein